MKPKLFSADRFGKSVTPEIIRPVKGLIIREKVPNSNSEIKISIFVYDIELSSKPSSKEGSGSNTSASDQISSFEDNPYQVNVFKS